MGSRKLAAADVVSTMGIGVGLQPGFGAGFPDHVEKESTWGPLVEAALNVASGRRVLLQEMRTAVELGDRERVFELAHALTGVKADECGGTHPRVH